jgi:hypothetical protein
MQTTSELVNTLREMAKRLSNMSKATDFSWSDPTEATFDAPRRLHNLYIQNLVDCYCSKFAQLSEAILDSAERDLYLVYALAGRSLIETTATLRYYVFRQYPPLLKKDSLTLEEMKHLIEIDDRHLRGGRFDWQSFFMKDYTKLKDNAVKQLVDKKAKRKCSVEGTTAEQVNVLTCIENWAEEAPGVLLAYNLFCDLVHPNIGSTLLVASSTDGHLYFCSSKGKSVGAQIFEQSLPILLSVTYKPFGDFLDKLVFTMWREDELRSLQ